MQVYCPKYGTGKILPSQGENGGPSIKTVRNIVLDECKLLPGTEVWKLCFCKTKFQLEPIINSHVFLHEKGMDSIFPPKIKIYSSIQYEDGPDQAR